MHRISDLRQRDVVNINDGKRLGMVSDVDVDPESGRIVALIVPGTGRFMGLFGGANDYVITWDRIVRIGPDVILVDWDDRERGGGRGGSRQRGEFGPGSPGPGNPGPGGFPPGMAPPGFGGMGGPLPPGVVMPQGMTTGGPLMPPGVPIMPGGMMPGTPGPPQEVEPDQERRRRPRPRQ